MRRSIPLLALILALQLGLAAILAVRKDPLAATTPSTPLIDTSLKSADDLVIEGKPFNGSSTQPTRVELARRNGQWVLPDYFNAPVDHFKLSAVLGKLAALKRGLPVATSSSALRRFEVEDGHFERRLVFSQGKKVLDTVYFGSAAGPHTSDARTAKDHAVYAVSLATYELPTQNSDWFDGDLVQHDPDSLTEIDVSAAPDSKQPGFKLIRQAKAAPGTASTGAHGGANAHAAANAGASAAATTAAGAAGATQTVWVDPTLTGGQQIDNAHAETFAREIAELHLDGILGVTTQPDWQQDHPLLTLGIRDDKHPGQLVTWTLSKPKTGDYYVLKDSAQPWYFQISTFAGKQLLDASASTQLIVATAAKAKEPADAKPGVHKRARPPKAGRV